MKLKNLLANKNVVTILGAILIVIVLYGFYMWRVNSAINPIRVPYALKTIGPRTKITNEEVGYLDIQQSSIMGNVLTNANTQIIGMYTNINSTIPEGSLFYEGMVVRYEELADSFLIDMPKDINGEYMQAYDFHVGYESTYGNSVYPGNYIDLYLISGNEDDGNSKIIYGKVASNVKVLAVKDGEGNHVFENITENREPSIIILAVDEELLSLLRVAEKINNTELKLVPTNVQYRVESSEEILTLTEDEVKGYIEQFRAN